MLRIGNTRPPPALDSLVLADEFIRCLKVLAHMEVLLGSYHQKSSLL